MKTLLKVENLRTRFNLGRETIRAVNGVSFSIAEGEVLGLVGESGCGKSITALSVMRLIASPGKIVGGEIKFKGEELLKASDVRMREIRGNDIAMIFQDPMTSLNPYLTVERQMTEVLEFHKGLTRSQARLQAVQALDAVKIPEAGKRLLMYPHEFSGGCASAS